MTLSLIIKRGSSLAFYLLFIFFVKIVKNKLEV